MFFLVPKKTGSWKTVLDVCNLNHFIHTQRFCIVTLASIIPSLEKAIWFIALDNEGCLHVNIHPAHRCFFQIHYFHYRVLSFGLPTAPRIVTKVFLVVAAH